MSEPGRDSDAQRLAAEAYARGEPTGWFDLSRTAIAGARERHPGSKVSYEVADLLQLPQRYLRAFDLVVESYTVQSLPEPPRSAAITAVAALVAPGGTLLVIAAAGDVERPSGPPFPLTRREIAAFAVDDVELDRLEDLTDDSGTRRWRASFVRARR